MPEGGRSIESHQFGVSDYAFETWFQALITENKELWKSPAIDAEAYASVRVQANVIAHLDAKSAPQKNNGAPPSFRDALQATLGKVD